MTEPISFRSVMLGYEPSEVDRVIAQLREVSQASVREAAATATELAHVRAAAAEADRANVGLRNRVAVLEEELAGAAPRSEEIGRRLTQILKLAEEEASELRRQARTDADTLQAESNATADQVRKSAQVYAADVTSTAEAEAVRITETARREADDIRDTAEREAAAIREEAAAFLESQRARAAASAADFERTLAERRDKAAQDFAAQMAMQEQALASAEQRLLALEAEGERVTAESAAQARAMVQAARDEAATTTQQARSHVERMRRESERELAAASARRDSINAQLTNLRQMLATLGGGTMTSSVLDAPAAAPIGTATVSVPTPAVPLASSASDVVDVTPTSRPGDSDAAQEEAMEAADARTTRDGRPTVI